MAYIEADSAAEAVLILREELRGLFDCVEIIARYRAQCNFGGVPVNGGRVPVGAAERAAVHRWQLSPREKDLQKLLGGREIRR